MNHESVEYREGCTSDSEIDAVALDIGSIVRNNNNCESLSVPSKLYVAFAYCANIGYI